MEITVLAKSLGLSETATDDEVQAALSAAVEKAGKVDDLEQKVQTLEAAAGDKTEVETLREELATERTKRIAREREDLFATAIREGRMAPSEKEALAEAFGEDTEKLDKVLAARPKNATIAREHGSGGDAKADDAPVDEETAKSFTTAEGDAPDAEQLSTHQKALAILAKDVYTEDEYMAAYAKAERGETVKG